jgi:hypothetical protein
VINAWACCRYITKSVREDQTPDKNGVITTWTIGANFLGCGLSVVLMFAGAVASMAAKAEVQDEGMSAALVTFKTVLLLHMYLHPQGCGPDPLLDIFRNFRRRMQRRRKC